MPAGGTPSYISELVLPASAALSVISDTLFSEKKVSVQLLRLDQVDPILSGNKAFKLIPNLINARADGFKTVLSFGGAYSNHLHALAEAGQRFDFKTIAVIRGDDGQADSHTLQFAASRGMRLIRVSRQDYRRRAEPKFIEELKSSLGEFYLIPEGGANQEGIRGAMQLACLISNSLQSNGLAYDWPDEILMACGTGTTMAGLIAGYAKYNHCSQVSARINQLFVRGIAVLKQGEFLRRNITYYLRQPDASGVETPIWEIETGHHWGGYARFPSELAHFMKDFEQRHGILLDPVYTAKLLSAVYQRVAAGLYAPGTRLLLLHTGGLQGRNSR